MIVEAAQADRWIHCRTGSLEMQPNAVEIDHRHSLPHRQLRNNNGFPQVLAGYSLPHRQLRKTGACAGLWRMDSLPHRQLRNDHCEPTCNAYHSLPHR